MHQLVSKVCAVIFVLRYSGHTISIGTSVEEILDCPALPSYVLICTLPAGLEP